MNKENFILERYERLINTPSDINEHLPVLFELAKEVGSIVELGTRNCVSATAFMAAFLFTDKVLYSYDLYRSNDVGEFEKFDNFHFFNDDALDVQIPNADLLFVDTLHTYFQLTSELNIHSKNINKYIVLHDTVSYAYGDESFYSEQECMIMSEKVKKGEKMGLVNAMNDFLLKDDGLNWTIHKAYENNNGLTILKRKIWIFYSIMLFALMTITNDLLKQ